jgi:hypothetical protein
MGSLVRHLLDRTGSRSAAIVIETDRWFGPLITNMR